MAFLCEVDMGGKKVPAVWSEALKILQKNYANSLVISAFADVMHYKIMIITVHGVNCCHVMFHIVCFHCFQKTKYEVISCFVYTLRVPYRMTISLKLWSLSWVPQSALFTSDTVVITTSH